MPLFQNLMQQQPQQQSSLLVPTVVNNPQAGTMQSAARVNPTNYISANGQFYGASGPNGQITPGGGAVNAQMTPAQQQWYMTEYNKQPEYKMTGPVTVMAGGPGVRVSGRPEMGGDGPNVVSNPNVTQVAPGTSVQGSHVLGNNLSNGPMSVADALGNLFGHGNMGSLNNGGSSSGGGGSSGSLSGLTGGNNSLQNMFSSILNAGGNSLNTNSNNTSPMTQNNYSLNQGYNTNGQYSMNQSPYAPSDTQSASAIQLQQLQNDLQNSYDPNGMQQLGQSDINTMIQQNPLYKAQYESGLQALNRTQARGGYLASGRALQESADFGTTLAGSVYDSLLNHLAGLTAQTSPLQQQYAQQTATNAGVNYQAGVAPAQARSSAALAVGGLQGQKAIQDSINKTQASIATSQNMTNASIANAQISAASNGSLMSGLGNIAGTVVGGLF